MSKLTARSTDSDPKKLGRQIEDLYVKSTLGLLDCIAMGDLVGQVRKPICSTRGTVATGGKDAKGDGIKGWLKEHAPSVPQSTAYRYEELAENVRDELKIGVKVPLAQIITREIKDPKAAKLLSRVSDFVAGKSARQLLIGIGQPDAEIGGKRTKSKKLTPAEEQAQWIEAATQTAVVTFSSLHELEERWKLLDDVQLKLAVSDAQAFLEEATEWLKTPPPNRPAIDAEKYLRATEDVRS